MQEAHPAYDAVVVGGGPAGLAAAAWLGRYRRRTLLVDAGEGRNRWAESMHGMPGSDRVTPGELRRRFREEVGAYPDVELRAGRVVAVQGQAGVQGEVVLELDDGERVLARRVVLATGVRDAFPDVDRFFDFYGADVHHCLSCDGYEARDQTVVAIGWQAEVAGFAVGLYDWAREVRIVTDGRSLECDGEVRAALDRHGVEVIEDRAVCLLGERGSLRGIELAGGKTVDCTMAFFSIAHEPVTDLAQALGCDLDADGYVSVDREGRTSVPVVYAAGDLTPGLQLVAVATGEGTVAGVACALSLQGSGPVAGGGATPAPDPDAVLGGE
jgi:thioredoxin reductase